MTNHVQINAGLRREITRCKRHMAKCLEWAKEARTELHRRQDLADAQEWAKKANEYEIFLCKRVRLGFSS